jgi:hypothetical protein
MYCIVSTDVNASQKSQAILPNDAEHGTSSAQTQVVISDESITPTTKLHSALNKTYFFNYYSKHFLEDTASIMSEVAYSHALSLSESDLNLLVMQAHEAALTMNTETEAEKLVITNSVKFWKRIRTMLGTFRNISIAATACVAGLYIWLPAYHGIIRNVLETSAALSIALWEGCKYSEKRVNTQMAQSNLKLILASDFKQKLPHSIAEQSSAIATPISALLSTSETQPRNRTITVSTDSDTEYPDSTTISSSIISYSTSSSSDTATSLEASV